MQTYILVSQGIKIDEIPDRDIAIEVAIHENNDWLNYVETCVDDYEPYADNEIYVYEVIDNNIENAKLIWDAGGEVKETK